MGESREGGQGSATITFYTNPAAISWPEDIVAGPDGALWFVNFRPGWIGRITTAGAATNYAHTGIDRPEAIAVGSDGALWFTNWGDNSIGRITTAGAVSIYPDPSISQPNEIAAGPDGALWFTNRGNNSIGRITTGGTISSYGGAGISAPVGIAAGSDGALWFTNVDNNSIGRITTGGAVTNYTGVGISQPLDITTGPDGALWFTNYGNGTIGRITTTGTVSNYADPGIIAPYYITAGPDGTLWFTNIGNFHSVNCITTTGAVTTYPAAADTGGGPTGITTGPDNAIWFSNSNTASIGRLRADCTPPVVTPPADVTIWTTGSSGAVVSYPPATATDNVGVTSGPTCTPASGSMSPVGTTTVTCTAEDAAGNVGSASFNVTVLFDGTPPTVSCSASPGTLWPPDHKLRVVTTAVTVEDAESGPAGFTLISVASDEPDDGLGDGDTADDIQGWMTGTADTEGLLRAERSGLGTGRVYTLTYEGADAAGNSAQCSTTVTVPHDQGK